MKDNPTIKDLPDIQSILHCVPDLYLILDDQLTIIDASNAYIKATMIKREEVIGRHIFDVFPDNPNDKNATGVRNLKASLNRVLREKVTDAMAVQKYDIRKPKEEGGGFEEHYWSPVNVPVLNKDGGVKYIIHRAEDVTAFVKMKASKIEQQEIATKLRTHAHEIEREIIKRAQEIQERNQALAQANDELALANIELEKTELNNAKLAAIVEFTQDAIISKTLDNIITSWNQGAEKLYGYTEAEVVGKSIKILFPKHLSKELKMIVERVKKNKPVKLETERLHKDGHIVPVDVTISPIKNKKGELVGYCSIARDISEWKKIEKMKNEFISIVSHELRTPLTSIQGSLSLLVAGAAGRLPEQAHKLLQIGKQNSERLIRLINDILDIEKIESGKMEFRLQKINIDAIVAEAILANQAYAEKFNVKLKLTEHANALVNVDRDRLLQVMANLISNAIKFAKARTEVLIQIAQVNDQLKVSVSNKGQMIPKEFQSRIFQKFAQADSSATRDQPGTGLGLSISKEIIEKLHGKINFTSNEKETTFYFTLPIMNVISRPHPLRNKTLFPKIPTILICEQDSNTADNLKMILEDNGFQTIVVDNANDVKETLYYKHVDALLLDLTLPEQDSISLIKDVRRSFSLEDLPIIVMSMHSQKEEQDVHGNALTLLDWIEKPVDLERLITVIKIIKKKIALHSPNVLHVEDDVDLLKIIGNLLQHEATIEGATTVRDAEKKLAKKHYDLVLLDLMLPDGSGIDLLPIITKKHIPIIVFSAYELPKDYAQYVVKVMMKSKSSVFEFVETIKASLTKMP